MIGLLIRHMTGSQSGISPNSSRSRMKGCVSAPSAMGINDGGPTKNCETRRCHALDEWADQQFPCRPDQAAFLFRSQGEDADRYWTAIPSNLVGHRRPSSLPE